MTGNSMSHNQPGPQAETSSPKPDQPGPKTIPAANPAATGWKEGSAEVPVLIALQQAVGSPQVNSVARGLSHFGEHALGWFALAGAGALLDSKRRREWMGVGVAAFLSHAASVVLKRIVRRPRPHDPRVAIGVGTPSKLSFPSSHATSTAAALVAVAQLSKSPLPLMGIPVMMASRMVLGVHYPTDVMAGALLGTGTALATRAVLERRVNE